MILDTRRLAALVVSEGHESDCSCPDCQIARPDEFHPCSVCGTKVFWEKASPRFATSESTEVDHYVCHGCESRGFA